MAAKNGFNKLRPLINLSPYVVVGQYTMVVVVVLTALIKVFYSYCCCYI